MGGKSKQTQRTKNNARPSNSGRSAELLGSSIIPFVGFSTNSELGINPFAQGFATIDSLPDTFDSNVSAQYQLVMRKMSKKDPVTKVKALQEFQVLLSDSDIDAIKVILPLWPKFYNNLSNDVEHRVRESAQQTQNIIATKAGKSIAPFLKQLAPIWISSQFDNYAPAASIAAISFKASFSENKIQEVLIFCQLEILEYITRNLTFHTPATLNSTKMCTPEEADNKYHRLLLVSLKTFALFIDKTKISNENAEIYEKIQILLKNQKFWSFSKNKTMIIRAAWFELIYSILQNAPDLFDAHKNQVMQICFQNMDDSDSLISPHIWGCILLIQMTFKDWHNEINFKKLIQPKLIGLFKNIYNGTAAVIGPNLLPFLANISKIDINDLELFEFYQEFLLNMKKSIISCLDVHHASKSDIAAIIVAFYECLRFIFKNINNEFQNNNTIHKIAAFDFLQNYIIDLIQWSFKTDHISSKYIFLHCSALISYWSNNINSQFYSNILKKFWTQFFHIITENLSLNFVNNGIIIQIVEFIEVLCNATPSLTTNHKVKFAEENNKLENVEKITISSLNMQKELKEIVIKLVQIYIERTSNDNPNNYVIQLKKLCDLFGDEEFYKNISKEKTLIATLEIFKMKLCTKFNPLDELIEIVLDIIFLLEKSNQFEQLRLLLKMDNENVQKTVLHRMLSYPLCIESEIREILSEKICYEIIIKTANDFIKENSKEKLNILHKCFFQIESGEILINKETVKGIMEILSQPLIKSEGYEHLIDICGSFISQNMPVICSDNNSTKELQNDIFLKLFQFSISTTANDNLSEDTHWEITTCWQDSLSSNDILMNDDILLKCAKIINEQIELNIESSILNVNNITDIVAKLLLCSTEKNDSDEKRYQLIDKYLLIIFDYNDNKIVHNQLTNLCTFFEAMKNVVTPNNLDKNCSIDIPFNVITEIFLKVYFKFSTIFSLCCRIKNDKLLKTIDEVCNEDDHEYTEDYCDPDENILKIWSNDIFKLITYCIRDAALGESLLKNCYKINEDVEKIIKNLSEKIQKFIENIKEDYVSNIKNRLIENSINGDILWIRTLPFVLLMHPYNEYEENGSILLFEDLSEKFEENNNVMGFIHFSEIMISKLSNKTLPKKINFITANNDILYRSSYFRSLIANHLAEDVSDLIDKELIKDCINFITEIGENVQKDINPLLYNEDISKHGFKDVITVTEFIKLLTECLEKFPSELNIKNWDSIRIGLCSWVLSISKSIETFNDPKVTIFVSACYELFAALSKFINDEKPKSSTQALVNIIDEWENLFSREVNLVLFRSFHTLVSADKNRSLTCYNSLSDVVGTAIESIDFNILFKACKNGFKITLDDLIEFLLNNLNNINSIRIASLFVIKKLSQHFITIDLEILEKHNEILENNSKQSNQWHYLNKFTSHLKNYGEKIEKYIQEFSYKLTELPELKEINRDDALNFLFIWDCIIDLCSKAPGELRSIYASWLSDDNKYEQILLNFIFRALPIEILKNYDSKSIQNEKFKYHDWNQLKDGNVTVDRYAFYMYFQMLRHLPAVVRKWWSSSNARQKLFIDKLTMNYVSNLIWQEDLQTISKKEKHENMQITVHSSTREVIAIYSIEEARMELVITLAQNHPLGSVKVESGKQIGGKALCRNVGMQLTIFLTHQNGSIFDGLSLWKKNLDKKFAGVEECYVCYTVIHQDTCQLPKLTCKTCKKKFHGPCLYKWFTTSSKSTCPLCRNVF